MPTLAETAKTITNDPLFLGSSGLTERLDWEAGDGKNTDHLIVRRATDADLDNPSELAILSVVGRISEEKCNILPCGGWNDNYDDKLYNVKARFTLVPARHHELQPLWQSVLKGMDDIQQSKKSRTGNMQYQIIVNLENSSGEGLRFRHTLFEVHLPTVSESVSHVLTFHKSNSLCLLHTHTILLQMNLTPPLTDLVLPVVRFSTASPYPVT